MRVFLLAAMASLSLMPLAKAEPGQVGRVLRTWSTTAQWIVALGTGHDNQPWCALLTGRKDANSNAYTIWGMRQEKTKTFAVITGPQHSIDAETIAVAVDGIPLGVLPIATRRDSDVNTTVSAPISVDDAKRLGQLLRVGASITFTTKYTTFQQTLTDMPVALSNFKACMIELRQFPE